MSPQTKTASPKPSRSPSPAKVREENFVNRIVIHGAIPQYDSRSDREMKFFFQKKAVQKAVRNGRASESPSGQRSKKGHATTVHNVRESSFVNRTDPSPVIPTYDGLQDRNLRGFFQRGSVQKSLLDANLIDTEGRVFDVQRNNYRIRMIQQELELYDARVRCAEENEQRRRRLLDDRRAVKRQHQRQMERVRAMREAAG
eukprot:RCo047447